MTTQTPEKTKARNGTHWRHIAAMLLMGFLVIMLFMLVRDIIVFESSGVFVPEHHPRELLRFRRPPTESATSTPLRVDRIQAWMTFDYVNKIFRLPSDMLKRRFSIVDKRYPNLSISRAARAVRKTPAAFLAEIRKAIASATSTQTTPLAPR